jgi:tRNA nucleotidyltransferase (CCA-adding enzyme)
MKSSKSFDLTLSLPPADLQLFQHVQTAAQSLNFPLYIVGGFVRDLILNIPSTDYDFVVEGNAILLAKQLVQTHGGELSIHEDFFTAKWYPLQSNLPEHIDLISARQETYPQPAQLPHVTLADITQDLKRRDFTINTLALALTSIENATLTDPFNGLDDIQQHTLRILHNRSFIDDPTRIFRFIRFEQRLDFAIEPHTMALLEKQKHNIQMLTGKRIQHEFDLYNTESIPANYYARCSEVGLFSIIHPAFILSSQTISALNSLNQSNPTPLNKKQRNQIHFILLLASHNPQDISAISERLMLSNEIKKSALQVHQFFTQPWAPSQSASQITFALDKLTRNAVIAAYHLTTDSILKQNIKTYFSSWRHIHPLVTGEDLKSLGLIPSPQFKNILQDLRTQKLVNLLPTKQEEIAYIKKHYFKK